MALRESDHFATPAASSVKESRDMATKSPPRELHRFSNGVLDVTPKGHKEEAMVLENQKSPLLRLPREIRDCIWSYVLDRPALVIKDYTYDAWAKRRLNGPALLRTCRQIYSETALFPLRSGTIIMASGLWKFENVVRFLQEYQREQVTKLRLDFRHTDSLVSFGNEMSRHPGPWTLRPLFSSIPQRTFKAMFPSIRQIEVLVFGVTNEGDAEFQDHSRRVSQQLRPTVEHSRCQLTVRGIPEAMNIALYKVA